MTRIELIGQNGLTGSRKFIVEKFPVTIGTSRDAGVQLTDPDVLPLHCEIEVHDGEIFVRDLSGKGLTYVNDTPVKEGQDRARLAAAAWDKALLLSVCGSLRNP